MTLVVRGLACARGGIPILQDVGFSLPAGRALFLRGPNGCGKTTLLRTIAGLQPALAGQIDVAPDSLAYASHADGQKATLSVGENLEFWARIHASGAIDPALAAFDLTDLRNRPAHSLSAGQKRRLGLARLLTTRRAVWLLDEPTVSLDAASVALFERAVQAHCAGGGSALIATHIQIDLPADTLDLTGYKAALNADPGFDEVFV